MLIGKDAILHDRFMEYLNNKKKNGYIYDLRINGKDTKKSGRWIDQKCTPDVFHIVLDSIVNYVEDNINSLQDCVNVNLDWKLISSHTYTIQNIYNLFSKPSILNKQTNHEYDKFFGQQLELLTYCGILKKSKNGRSNIYNLCSEEDYKLILELNNSKQRVIEIFIYSYVNFVLEESGLKTKFDFFLNQQNKVSFDDLRKSYIDFYKLHTNSCSKSEDTKDITRIFPKVLNIISYIESKKGTIDGRLSDEIIQNNNINYNRKNFRDKNKERVLTRKEYEEANKDVFVQYYESKAKKQVKKYNRKREELIYLQKCNCPLGEVKILDQFPFNAQEAHHMIAKHENMEYSDWIENLILLTPNQHTINAHPNGNTQTIDKDYQKNCFVSKYEIILESLSDVDTIYNIEDYFKMLNEYVGKQILLDNKNYSVQEFKQIIYNS